ncbi:sporulation membrane protein YtrI [Pallidibacillus pasinlerensis]|uniref:Sporulation protein n=1 Tax=Pallidibacillus pasinlerensis TaxID=2703818 RepID=A0ABX0A7Q2_9BACI|nr:sporulation membrane protein YtrI [Pallidibacillus pasinlerensis]NCU18074.1 sporulation protein [Pallidibacillus pasinlerensis]
MRMPSFYRSKDFQRMIVGVVIGAIISWLTFLYIFGEMQEEQVTTIRKQQEQIANLEKEKNIWQEDYKKLNEKNKELLTVQDFTVKITNASKYKIDPLSVFEAEEAIKKEIDSTILAKNLDELFNNRALLIKLIENKQIEISDRKYELKVSKFILYTTVIIELELSLAD